MENSTDVSPKSTPKSTLFLNASDVTFRVGTDGGELGAASERICLWIMREGEDMAVVEISSADAEAWLRFLERMRSARGESISWVLDLAVRRLNGSLDRFGKAADNLCSG
jgi:hypothetical protein